MAKKEFTFYGKKLEELQQMSMKEFAQLCTSRARRSLSREMTEQQKALYKKIQAGKREVKTHARDMVITPEMVGKTIKVHNGKEFVALNITDEMLGHFLGEFALSRKVVSHSSPGVGATKSSANLSVK